jgi:hypothetical protein
LVLILHALVISVASLFAPGFFILRRVQWSGAERVASAWGLSALLLGLLMFGLFACGLAPELVHLWTAIGLGLLIVGRKELRGWLMDPETRRALAAQGVFALLGIVWLSLVRGYAGGDWGGDWVEHFQRSQLFLGNLPLDTQFLSRYPLPSQPPLANLVSAAFQAQLGTTYPVHQIAIALQGSAIFSAALVCVYALSLKPARCETILLALFAASPLIAQNLTFSWTKLPSAAFVLLGIGLMINGFERNDPRRRAAGTLALAAGALSHYSALPYIAVLYPALAISLHQRGRWARELITHGLIGFAVLSPWIVWSLFTYGPAVTFGSNSTVTGAAGTPLGDNLIHFLGNLWNTLVPLPLRPEVGKLTLGLGWISDLHELSFVSYVDSLPLAFGSAGAFLLIYELIRRSRAGDRLWVVRVCTCAFLVLLLGVAVHTRAVWTGLTSVTLLPLVLLGLALLASGHAWWPAWARVLLTAGLILDAILGVMLHLAIESSPVTLGVANGGWDGLSLGVGPTASALRNAARKAFDGLEFAGDLLEGAAPVLASLAVLLTGALIFRAQSGRSRPIGS